MKNIFGSPPYDNSTVMGILNNLTNSQITSLAKLVVEAEYKRIIYYNFILIIELILTKFKSESFENNFTIAQVFSHCPAKR